MTVRAGLVLDDWFARELVGLHEPWQAAALPSPRLLALNDDVARELGIDTAWLRTDDGIAALTGQSVPDGARPVAQAYAGHQFGGYSPRLGDGRALLLGEVVDPAGRHRDLHLKGSGRTPFARGGDGKAAVGPMLRELVVSEAMHALGIPTTRALAVVATGEMIARESMLPGAVLARVASSHLRVGTFQYAASLRAPDLLRRLASHAISRHYPEALDAQRPFLSLFEHVVAAQARLVAQWMLVGFVHGVMNTDNMTISGETIDYGPCAFMDAYDPATVFSSIDHGGRYAWGNQPNIAQWNLARLAEALLTLIDDDDATAVTLVTEVLHTFPARFEQHWREGMRAKLGLTHAAIDTDAGDLLVDDLLSLLHTHGVDYTSTFRAVAASLRGDDHRITALFDSTLANQAYASWATRWRLVVDTVTAPPHDIAASMDAVNPVYVPRNHLVEDALAAATTGDLLPLESLLDVVRHPFTERDGLERYAEPAPTGSGRYVTFCGT
ncbi:MAG: protein adenylyltransferase SelO [Ilumatobacteraceae bacterium]